MKYQALFDCFKQQYNFIILYTGTALRVHTCRFELFQTGNRDRPSDSLQLMGGKVEELGPRVLGVDDGVRGYHMALMKLYEPTHILLICMQC